MATSRPLTEKELNDLRKLNTCLIANAIETFNVRLHNTGFTSGKIWNPFPEEPPMVGYAVTAKLRSGEPPIGGGTFHDRAEFWNYIQQGSYPRVLVLEDVDRPRGRGAFVGDMHAAILKALGCVGYVTNGAVRELDAVHELGFHLFAESTAVSHAYAHIFDTGATVTVDGLEIHPGDLLHGDQHGLITIPAEIAHLVHDVAVELRQREAKVISFCHSPSFSITGLAELREEMKK